MRTNATPSTAEPDSAVVPVMTELVEPDASRSVRPGRALLMILLAAAVLTGGLGGWQLWSQHRNEVRDAAVLELARQVAADLVTVGSEDPQGDVERILDGTTGELRQQFADVADVFTTALESGAVTAVGEVTSAGVVESSADRALVIAAVVATVSNGDLPQGQRRAYRMRLTVENVDGHWAVSNMEVLT